MTSLRKAIDAKCKDCIFDEKSGLGTWRQQTTACTSVDCSLYPVRPISKPKKAPTGNPVPESLRKYHEQL